MSELRKESEMNADRNNNNIIDVIGGKYNVTPVHPKNGQRMTGIF